MEMDMECKNLVRTKPNQPQFIGHEAALQVSTKDLPRVDRIISNGRWDGSPVLYSISEHSQRVMIVPADDNRLKSLQSRLVDSGIDNRTVWRTIPVKETWFRNGKVHAVAADKWPFAAYCRRVEISYTPGQDEVAVTLTPVKDGIELPGEAKQFDTVAAFIGATEDSNGKLTAALRRVCDTVLWYLTREAYYQVAKVGLTVARSFHNDSGRHYLLSLLRPRWSKGDEYDEVTVIAVGVDDNGFHHEVMEEGLSVEAARQKIGQHGQVALRLCQQNATGFIDLMREKSRRFQAAEPGDDSRHRPDQLWRMGFGDKTEVGSFGHRRQRDDGEGSDEIDPLSVNRHCSCDGRRGPRDGRDHRHDHHSRSHKRDHRPSHGPNA